MRLSTKKRPHGRQFSLELPADVVDATAVSADAPVVGEASLPVEPEKTARRGTRLFVGKTHNFLKKRNATCLSGGKPQVITLVAYSTKDTTQLGRSDLTRRHQFHRPSYVAFAFRRFVSTPVATASQSVGF